MERFVVLVLLAYCLTCLQYTSAEDLPNKETVLSAVLDPTDGNDKLKRQSRSYYDYRYGAPRPLYDRLEFARLAYDRPQCGRCEDRYDRGRDDRDDDYDSRDSRDRYDDDRRGHRPTSGNRYDNKKNRDRDYDRDRDRDSNEDRYSDRKSGQKNGTEEENGDNNKNSYDDKDSRPSGSRRGSDRDKDRDRDRDGDRDRERDSSRRRGGNRGRDRYDDRDRYKPDYYDRFLRDPYRERDVIYYERDGEIYRERRPVYYEEAYGRYDGYGSPGYRRPELADRGYDDGYGGYGPTGSRGPHDRPWDETYRGQAGWDAGGRGYYFASGRPDPVPATGWGRPEYSRAGDGGWQTLSYSGSYRDPYSSYGQSSTGYGGAGGYSGSSGGYGSSGYGGGYGSTGYGQSSGWQSVGERRPYRDESGVKNLENREKYNQSRNPNQYPANNQPSNYNQHSQSTNYGQNYPQGYQSSSTTPGNNYLFQREDEQVTVKVDESTKKTA